MTARAHRVSRGGEQALFALPPSRHIGTPQTKNLAEPAEATSPERSVLPATLDVITAAGLLGIGRTLAYQLVRTGGWPTPLIRLGKAIRVPTRPLLDLLDGAGCPQAAATPAEQPPAPPRIGRQGR
jgi:hypothetical protein